MLLFRVLPDRRGRCRAARVLAHLLWTRRWLIRRRFILDSSLGLLGAREDVAIQEPVMHAVQREFKAVSDGVN